MSFNWQDKMIAQLDEGRNLVVGKYGSGKCRVSMLTLQKEVRGGRWAVIIAPKRNQHTWVQELPKWLDSGKVGLHLGEIGLALDAPYLNIVLLTPQQVEKLHDQIVALEPKLVILDESTIIKNSKAIITTTLLRLSRCCKYARKVALTGNPTPEHETELWTQMEFCYPGINPLGRTFYQFLNRWFIKADYVWAMRLDKREEFFDLFDRYAVRMDEADWEEHAEAVGCREEWEIHQYKASDEQLRLLDDLRKNWSLTNSDGEEEQYWHTMAILQKGLQISDGFYYIGDRVEQLSINPKRGVLRQVVSEKLFEGVQRIVVWYTYDHDLSEIKAALEGLVKVWSSRYLTKFSQPSRKPKVIALPLSFSRGINDLIVAPVDIYWSNSPSQELRDQAESRLPRPGQRSTVVTHIDLCSAEMPDSKVVSSLQNKDLTKDRCKAIVMEVFGDGIRHSGTTTVAEG